MFVSSEYSGIILYQKYIIIMTIACIKKIDSRNVLEIIYELQKVDDSCIQIFVYLWNSINIETNVTKKQNRFYCL